LFVIKAFDKNRQKDYRTALAAAGTAREMDPGSVDAMANYAYALGGLGQREQMMDLLEQAAAKDARYQASLQDAKNRPVGSDILFLFPGEFAAGGPAQPSAPEESSPPSRTRRFGVLAVATVLGGMLVAFGFLQSVAGPLTKRLKTALAKAPASVDNAVGGGPATLTPRPLNDPDGELLRGQYKLLRQIGAGGMGLVFEGTDVTLNRPVAVKKMRDELRLDRRERMHFINEAKTVAALHHPNIVDIYAVIEEGDELFLVFEFVNGHTIYDVIRHRGALGFPEALGIIRGMVAALDYAHGRGIIHRDLKPSNVMLNKEGFIKVMDFGIARMAKDAATRVSMTNTVAGTPPYMAPEQEQGVVRKEADIYSLAICFYEMLSGRVAFAGTGAGMLMNKINMSYLPISQGVSGLPQGIDLVFANAFQADPNQRFHSAGEFLSALEALPRPRS
jgi:serine/threonine-protein kinase